MADEKVTATEDSGENFAEMFKASQENAQGRVKQGDKVTGTVIDVTDDSVFVNVGVKIDGIMDRKDFIDNEGNLTVKVGDEVEAYVTKATSQEIVLSRSMNGAGMAAIENAKDAGIPVEGRVIDACKGGYHVEILGKTAFCPGSQMAAGEPESLPGQTFQFLITRVESRGRNIVVSHRALVDREREASLEKFLSEVKEGDIIEGKVTRLAPFGAFVEVAPAVEGMIHLSELSWSRVVKADEAVSVEKVLKDSGALEVVVAKDAAEKTRIWEARRVAIPALARCRPTLMLEDATVPRSKIPAMLEALDKIAARHHVTIGTFGHAGDGNLHPTFMCDKRDKDEFERVERAVDELFNTTIEMGGTLSGEHGIGTAKQKWLEKETSRGTIGYSRRLRKAIDPKGLFNPSKLVGV